MSVQEANRAYGRLRHQEVLADLTVREAATALERYKDLIWPRRKTREMKRQVRELEAALLAAQAAHTALTVQVAAAYAALQAAKAAG